MVLRAGNGLDSFVALVVGCFQGRTLVYTKIVGLPRESFKNLDFVARMDSDKAKYFTKISRQTTHANDMRQEQARVYEVRGPDDIDFEGS